MTNSDDNKTGFGLSQFQRNRYFYGKLMTVNDFDSEQGYMNEKRHLLNRLVSGAGVICGLRPDQDDVEISNAGGNIKIKFVTGGAAIDGWGREIVIPIEDNPRDIWVKKEATQVNLTLTELESAQYYLYLEYDPREGEMVSSASESSGCEETCCPSRVIENFQVIASAAAPDTLTIACPDFTGESTEDTARQKVKKWLVEQTSALCNVPGESKIFFLALKKGGSLLIDRQKTAQYITFVANNRALSELVACHLSDFGNPHNTTAAQVGALKSVEGVESPGGNIDLVNANSITILPDIPGKKITIGETHSGHFGNPHETEHEELQNVLPIFGDAYNEARNKHVSNNDAKKWDGFGDMIGVKTINHVDNPGGNVDLVPQDSIVIIPNDAANTITIGETHSGQPGNPHQTKHEDIKEVLPVFGDKDNDKRNKHISNNDAEKWNRTVESVGLKSINSVDNPGGNIDLIGKSSIIVTPDPETKSILIEENHSTDMNNPHGTTAEQVKALSINGGSVKGDIHIEAAVIKGVNGLGLYRTDEDNRRHHWNFWHMDSNYGKNHLQLWEYKTDSKGLSCNGNPDDGAICAPRLTVAEGGNVGIGTRIPQYLLHVDGTLFVRNWAAVGSDYSEYFESEDGKSIPPGTSVVIKNEKIRSANKNETPMGIISANPGMTGGVHVEWPKKYLKDEFGNRIMEEYQKEIMVPKKEKVKKERRKMEKKSIKEKVTRTEIVEIKGKYCQKEVIDTIQREIEEPVFKEVDLYDAKGKEIIGKHRIPVMETYEEEIDALDEKGQPVLVGTGKFETKTRAKINPEFDEKKAYIPRDKRPEWNCVGLLGQLPLLKGQPTAPTWVKIKDLTKDVELWLVK